MQNQWRIGQFIDEKIRQNCNPMRTMPTVIMQMRKGAIWYYHCIFNLVSTVHPGKPIPSTAVLITKIDTWSPQESGDCFFQVSLASFPRVKVFSLTNDSNIEIFSVDRENFWFKVTFVFIWTFHKYCAFIINGQV